MPPRSRLEPFDDDIRRMYQVERMTDAQIAESLSRIAGAPIKVDAVFARRRRLGIATDKNRGRYAVSRRYEDIDLVELRAAWEASFTETTLATGGVRRRGSAKKVGEYFGVSAGVANGWLKRAGLMADRGTRQQWAQRVAALYHQGASVERIAEIEDVTPGTVSRTLKAASVEIIPSEHRRTPEQKEAIRQAIAVTKSSEEYQQRTRETNLERYGVPHPAQVKLAPETIAITATAESLRAYIDESGVLTVVDLHQALGCSYSYIERILKRFGLWDALDHYTSFYEAEIAKHFAERGVVLVKDRAVLGNREIDLYSPEHRIGIEINGDYWHSEKSPAPARRIRTYHQHKSQLAESKGIFIYHVFEHEWKNPRKRAAILNQLDNLFGLSTRRLGARQCEIREVGTVERRHFLDANHVQGNDRCTEAVGLYLGEELLSLMSFTRPRFTTEHPWELSRYASKAGVSVAGGASRLFSHFVAEHHPTSVISYSDAAKTRGGMYERLGFTFSHQSEPNYVWTNFAEVRTRYQCQVHRLRADLLGVVRNIEAKSEADIMDELGYVRIYDCGSKVWVWTL